MLYWVRVSVISDLKVDLEELVAQEHHPPLLRVVDPGTAVGIEQNQTKASVNLDLRAGKTTKPFG